MTADTHIPSMTPAVERTKGETPLVPAPARLRAESVSLGYRDRTVVDRLDRETWVAPAEGDWTLVLPDAPAPAEARDDVDPYDLVGLGRALCHHGIDQVLILSVQDGYGVGQLMSRSKKDIPHYYLSTTIDLRRARLQQAAGRFTVE